MGKGSPELATVGTGGIHSASMSSSEGEADLAPGIQEARRAPWEHRAVEEEEERSSRAGELGHQAWFKPWARHV
jgi:hypothetical protein